MKRKVYIGLILTFLLIAHSLDAQEQKIETLIHQLEVSYGIDKLITINQLSIAYQDSSNKIRSKYAKQAITLVENLMAENEFSNYQELTPFVTAYFLSAKVKFDKELYFDAKSGFEQVLFLDSILEIEIHKPESQVYLGRIESIIEKEGLKENKLFKKLNRLRLGKQFNDFSLKTKIRSTLQLGKTKESLGNTEGAIKHYKEAINYSRDLGDFAAINELQLKISTLLSEENKEEEAQSFLEQAIQEQESELFVPKRDSITTSLSVLKNIADSLSNAQEFQQSLTYYSLYNDLLNQHIEDSIQSRNKSEQRKKEILLLKQQKKIADLNVKSSQLEKDKQLRLKNTILIIACLILLASLLVLYFYFAKKKEHRKLNETYVDLKQAQSELEAAEQKIVTLLKQQVSEDIADKLLIDSNHNKAEKHFVCILFLDIRNFTVRAEQLSPEELINFQNQVFEFMIDGIEKHHGNVNQLLGDGFMATFGAPVSHGNDCENAFQAAIHILRELERKINQSKIPPIKIGIGMHAGHVVSGNVGNSNRKQYSITGNPVIITSRIEQLNKTFNSQFILSKEAFHHLESQTQESISTDFKEVSLKGRSEPIQILVIE